MKAIRFQYIFWLFFLSFLFLNSLDLEASSKKASPKKAIEKASSQKKKKAKKVASKAFKIQRKKTKTFKDFKEIEDLQGFNIYIVKKGDTLFSIAKNLGVSVEELKRINKLKSKRLAVNQRLVIPVKGLGEVKPKPLTSGEIDQVISGKEKAQGAKDLTFQENLQAQEQSESLRSEENYILHSVKKGENPYRIAKKYGISVEELLRVNAIDPKDLKPGRQLKIPKKEKEFVITFQAQAPFKVYHQVKKGETLKTIAKKYGVSVEELKKLNRLKNSKLSPGKRLLVKVWEHPVTPEKVVFKEIELTKDTETFYQYHIVKPGETLYSIALLYQVPLEKLKEINYLNSNLIGIGQRLKIPPREDIGGRIIALTNPKESLESKEESLSQKFEKNILKKNQILTPERLSGEEKTALKQKFIELSMNLADNRYRLGGNGNGYMDCSALVQQIYKKLGIDLPRSSIEQFQVGVPVDREELIPGDLVFFKTRGNRVSHVGIYLGEDRFLHISSSTKKITIDSLDSSYFRTRYVGAKRVLNGEVLEYFQDYLKQNNNNNNSKESFKKPEERTKEDSPPEIIL